MPNYCPQWLRANQRVRVHVNARVNMSEGEKMPILVEELGTFGVNRSHPAREKVKSTSGAPPPAWVNSTLLRAEGTVSLVAGGT